MTRTRRKRLTALLPLIALVVHAYLGAAPSALAEPPPELGAQSTPSREGDRSTVRQHQLLQPPLLAPETFELKTPKPLPTARLAMRERVHPGRAVCGEQTSMAVTFRVQPSAGAPDRPTRLFRPLRIGSSHSGSEPTTHGNLHC